MSSQSFYLSMSVIRWKPQQLIFVGIRTSLPELRFLVHPIQSERIVHLFFDTVCTGVHYRILLFAHGIHHTRAPLVFAGVSPGVPRLRPLTWTRKYAWSISA